MEFTKDFEKDVNKGVISAGKIAGKLAVVFGVATTLTVIVNGVQSYREFDDASAQVRMLAETGTLTNKDGSPKNHTMERQGNKFSVSVTSALLTVNAQATTSAGRNDGQGVSRTQQFMSGSYQMAGEIHRVEPAKGWLRFFFLYGGDRSFNLDWSGGKPAMAPLSSPPVISQNGQVFMGAAIVVPSQANDVPATTPAPASAPR